MNILEIVFSAFWLMVPPYIANSSAVVFGGGKPIDLGFEWNGERVLGDGKTWRGAIGGFISGFIVSHIFNFINNNIALTLPIFPLIASISLPLGAILGDILASFIKRRIGHSRGEPLIGIDQLDFVMGSWILTIILAPIWFQEFFTLYILIAIVFMTPLIHFSANLLGYSIGIKKEPW